MTPNTPLPLLLGRHVLLRPMQADDVTPAHVAWLNDPLVVQHSNQRFVQHTAASCLQYLARFEGSPDVYASVRLQGTDRAVGTITAYRSLQHGTADIGILMGERSFWGQGLGADAFGTLADWLAAQPGMRKLTCGTLACNHGMLAVAHRVGFAREAIRVGQELVEGQPTDLVYFARFC